MQMNIVSPFSYTIETIIQSLIFAAILFIVGFQVLVVGLVADVISFNRRLIEETLLRVRRIELTHLNPRDKT